MKNNIYVKNYQSILDVHNTQVAIKLVKDSFERKLSEKLGLIRVTAPLFVEPTTGLNDELSGVEKAVNFKSHQSNTNLEIVQSLAKWKRHALHKYNCSGLYTDMNAIRPFEDLDNIHSLYVDQWDWEKVVTEDERTYDHLKEIVSLIYAALKETADLVYKNYPQIKHNLPREITFITSEALEEMYPNLDRKSRENEITKLHKAVFLSRIGHPLKDGKPHDSRASDYDDWDLNGDLLLWFDELGIALEISSMGIRVNKESLLRQLEFKNEQYKLEYEYHKNVINDVLPLTIGGGIGQSRMCMFMLKKAHIGEVQVSYWEDEDITKFKELGIELL